MITKKVIITIPFGGGEGVNWDLLDGKAPFLDPLVGQEYCLIINKSCILFECRLMNFFYFTIKEEAKGLVYK